MPDSYAVVALRAQVGQYLTGQIDRRQLDEWLFPLVWSDEGGHDAIDLAWSVELLLMEASGGYLSEEELRAALMPFVPFARIELGDPAPVTAASPSTFTRAQIPGLSVGARPVTVLS